MKFYSPLRYPGGKGKVANYFKQIIKDNSLYDGVYVEPYAGGASVALSLLINEYVSKIIINDIDRSIFAFWHSILEKTDKFCKLIEDTPVNVKTWKKQKNIQKEKSRVGMLQLGFSTFFLNRTNRSGILNAGVIGGLEQKGIWKIDARYNKKQLIDRIKQIATYKDRIKAYNLDAMNLIKTIGKGLPQKTLFYFDPPYYVKGNGLYLNHYNDNDHEKVATEISNLNKQKWMLTYDNVEPIRTLYKMYRQVKYNLNYSAGIASKGQEIMIFSDNLLVSDTASLQLASV